MYLKAKDLTLVLIFDTLEHFRCFSGYVVFDQNEVLLSMNATYTFTVNEDMYVYAKFVEKEKFIFHAYPTDGGSITENGEEVDFGNGRRVEKGTQITLTAVVHENYNFAGWYYIHEQQVETQLSMNLTYTFTVNGNMRVYAKFVEKEMYTFFAYPSEAGYFTENGQPVEFSESRRVEKGTKITLTAHVREPDYRFVGWYHASDQNETLITTNATCTFTVNEDMYVYAKFVEKEKFNFHAYAMGEGLILENGEAVDFGNGRRVEKGTKITLTAVASETYNFVGWYTASDQNETLISPNATYTFTVNEDMYVYAKFVEKEMYTFIVYESDFGYFTENGQQVTFGNGRRVEKGTKITLTAHAREQGYRFVGWYHASDQNETLISPNATYTFTVNEDMYVYASFERTN